MILRIPFAECRNSISDQRPRIPPNLTVEIRARHRFRAVNDARAVRAKSREARGHAQGFLPALGVHVGAKRVDLLFHAPTVTALSAVCEAP